MQWRGIDNSASIWKSSRAPLIIINLPNANSASMNNTLGDAFEADMRKRMLACWTRKEAYGKTLGVGIRYYLNRVALCTELDSPTWRCAVGGLFDDGNDGKSNSNSDGDSTSNRDSDDNVGSNIDRVRVLHGVQIAPPFAGVGALMYDGDALDDAQLHGAQLRP